MNAAAILAAVTLAVALPAAAMARSPVGERLALTLRANTVAVRAELADGSTESGFGMVVAEDGGRLWIATPNHVVRGFAGDARAQRVTVRFHGVAAPARPARLLAQHDAARDIAVLVTAAPEAARWYRFCAGAAGGLARGDPVWFVGQAGRWYVPSRPGVVNELDPAFGIVVDGLSTQVGSSGAPLVSARGIVGLIASDAMGATHNAIPLQVVAERFAAWGLPWSVEALSLARTRPAPLAGVDEAVAAGDALRARGDVRAAAGRYAQALEIDGADPLALQRAYATERDLALEESRYPDRLFMDHERSAGALRLAYRLLEVDGSLRDVELQLQIATLTRLAAGSWSVESLLASLEPFLDDARVRAEAGLLRNGYVDRRSGLELLREAQAQRPADPLVQRYLAFALRNAGELPASVRAYATAAQLSTGDEAAIARNRRASLEEYLSALFLLDELDPDAVVSGDDDLPLAERAGVLEAALAELANPPGKQAALGMLARMRLALGQREAAEEAAVAALGWPPSRRVGFHVEGLAVPRLRATVELAAALLRESGSRPALLYALERHVLGIDSAATSTPGAWLRPALQLGHSGRVLAVAVSPDGRWIASGGDHSVHVWHAASGAVERLLGPQVGDVCAVGFSRDGRRVAAVDQGTATREGRLHVWELASGRRLQSTGPVDGSVCAVAFDARGALLAVDGRDGGLAAWSADSPPRALAALDNSPRAMVASPRGDALALIPCCAGSRVLELRDARSGELRRPMELAAAGRALAFDASGRRLAVVNADRQIETFEVRSGKRLGALQPSAGSIGAIAVRPDGAALALVNEQARAVEVWHLAAASRTWQLAGRSNPRALAWMPDGRRLVAGYAGGEIAILAADTGEVLRRLPAARADSSVAVGPAAGLLVVGTDATRGSERVWDTTLWDLGTRRLRCRIAPAGPFGSVAFSPDGRWMALGNDSNYRVAIVDTQCGQPLGEIDVYPPRALSFAPDGRFVAHVDRQDAAVIVLRDLEAFEPIGELRGHAGGVTHLRYQARDGRLASASRDGTIRIWDPASGAEQLRIDAHEDVAWIEWSPDGRLLASTGDVSEAAIWDAREGRLRLRFSPFFDSGPHALRFAPDGETLVAVSAEAGTVTRWRVADGAFLGELALDLGGASFRGVLPAPDPGTLALAVGSVKDGGKVVLVDLVSGSPRRAYRGLPDGGWLALAPGGDVDGPPAALARYATPP